MSNFKGVNPHIKKMPIHKKKFFSFYFFIFSSYPLSIIHSAGSGVHPHRERRSAFSAAGHRWPHATPRAPAAAPSPAQVRAAQAATAWLPVSGHYLASRCLPRSPCSAGCVCAAPAAAAARLPAVGHYSASRRLPCSASRPASRHRELRQAPTARPAPCTGRGKMVLDCRCAGGAARSHVFVAPPSLWKPSLAPDAAPSLELLQKLRLKPLGRTSPEAACGAAEEALPTRA